MVERYDEQEGQEDGEYHFSDDQANYDMEADPSTKDSAAVATAPGASIGDKIKNHRRMVIGIIVFIVLLGIVYKLVAPTATAPVTDFQQGTPVTAPVKKVMSPPVSQPHTVPAAPVQQPAVTTTVTTQPAMPAAPIVSQPTVMPTMPQQQPAVIQQPTTGTTTTTTTVAPVEKSVPDRLATLEQENAALMTMMQTQFAQKMADAEAQNAQLRGQVQELTGRLSNMEVAFRQLTKMLRNPSAGGPINRPAPVRVAQPRMTYTVQAIIPGRAWLKSESGDTVTVAEGDVLKGYGRIAKIDPYDGIVDIDTGNRMISLSYGASGD